MATDISQIEEAQFPSPDRWLALAFVLMISLPGLFGVVDDTTGRRRANGEHASRRPPLVPGSEMGAWLRSWHDYLGESFGLRQELIETNAQLKKAGGLGRAYRSPVTAGPDGWLFLKVRRGTQRIYPELPFQQSELDAWAVNVEAQERMVRDRGSQFLFVIVPDKQSIYPDRLPADLPAPLPVSRTDALVARLRADGVAVLDLRQALREARTASSRFGAWPLYHRTDTHWNALGAWVGFGRIVSALGNRFPAVRPEANQRLEITTTEMLGGDLARMDGIQDSTHESVVRVRLSSARCSFAGSPPPGARTPEAPLIDAQDLECQGAPIRRGLILHDSMMPALTPFLGQLFERSTWRRTQQLDPALLGAVAPDVVIREMVERTLSEDVLL